MSFPGGLSRRAALVSGAAVVLAGAATGVAASRSDDRGRGPAAISEESTTTTLQVIGAEAHGAFAGSAQVTTSVAAATPSTAPASTATTHAAAAETSTTLPTGTTSTVRQGGDHRAVQAALRAAQARWAASKPARGYTWRYTPVCWFCKTRYEVDVDGAGRVTAVRSSPTYAGTGNGTTTSATQPLSHGRTVESEFRALQDAIDRKALSISARFDPVLGFATDYAVHLDVRLADGSYGITNVSLTPRA